MRKKVLLVSTIIALGTAVAHNINVNSNSKNNPGIDLTLANVEALALGEVDPNHCSTSCYNSWCGEVGISGSWFQLYYCNYDWPIGW
ncbi:MAG: NVEALA domain-containing protein [Dysgonamonadaceae bacterium]|jgi:hypothetical protein|nr:NVEALA domain-containing protein [Dysgonamonadaceae bacterium]